MKKVATFARFFVYTRTRTKDAKVEQGVHLFFSFSTNIVSNNVKKVCFKIIFINIHFICKTHIQCFFQDIQYCQKFKEKVWIP